MHIRRVSGIACVIALTATLQLWEASAAPAPSGPCGLIAEAMLHKVLGLGHIEERATIGPKYPRETQGRVASTCFVEAWLAAKPTTPGDAERDIANGRGAEFDISTFVTDSAAPPEIQQAWVNPGNGYDRELTLIRDSPRFLLGLLNRHHGLRGILFSPPKLRAEEAEGFQYALPPNDLHRRIRAASAYWADESSHSIISIGLIEGTRASRVRERLRDLAALVVPRFGL